MPDIKLTKIQQCLDKVKELSDPTSSERHKALSEWRRKGEYPFQLIGLQFEILEYYFNSTKATCSVAKDPHFLNLMYKLVNALSTPPCLAKDARFFYSQTLEIGTKQVCMYDLLKKVTEDSSGDIRSDMESFALLLSKNDPSRIARCEGLKPIYQATFVGPGFSLSYFRERILPFLSRKASPAILDRLNALASQIQHHSVPSTDDINELKAIFALRWSEVAGGKQDYTKNQQGVNADWIMVAQLLSGAGIFPVDYYNILMPTLQHTRNIWTKDRLTDYPLSHYILSTDKTRLILLDTCAHHYHVQKIEPRHFYNCSVNPPVKFDRIERSRIRFAAPRFRHFENVFNNENNNKEELPLKRSTVLFIAEFLKAILENGVTTYQQEAMCTIFDEELDSLPGDCRARVLTSEPLEEDIAKVLSSQEVLIIRSDHSCAIGFCNNLGDYQQEEINDPAIWEFLRPYEEGDFITNRGYKDKLNEILTSFECRTRIDEERLRFLYHRIKFGAFDVNPKYILGQIAFGLDPDIDVEVGCISVYCKIFIQLVANYSSEPSDFDFSDEIEKMISDHSMRKNATKMVFSDALCFQGEAVDRNLILLRSLLMYPFPSSPSEETYIMPFLNYENTTTDPIVQRIFEQLTNEFENTLANRTNRAYKPVDIMNEVVLPFILQGGVDELPLETQNWFRLIRTKDFFSNQCNFYDSKHLFLALSPLGSYTHIFLDEVLHIMQQPGDRSIHMLHINMKFSSFLSTLDDEQQSDVLNSLANTRSQVTYSAFFKAVYHFIISRMPAASPPLPSESTWLSNLFSRKPAYSLLTEKLKRTEETQVWDNFGSVEEVLALIQDVVDNTQDVALPVIQYLASKNPATPVSSSCGGTRYSSRTNSSSGGSVHSMTSRSAIPSPLFTHQVAPGGPFPFMILGK